MIKSFKFLIFTNIYLCILCIKGLSEIVMDLCNPGDDVPRYTVYILDQPIVRGNGQYAAFIVPQGRYSLFSNVVIAFVLF